MKAAIYARVSTGKQAAQELSIPDQIAQCERYCAARGWTVERTFVDRGVSATTDERPEFQAMIGAATARPRGFDVVLVHSQSRFSREVIDLVAYIRKLEKSGVTFVSITQDVGTGENAELLRTILGAFDQHDSAETAKHVKRAMIENARQGFWNGSTPPFGYRTIVKEKRGLREKKVLAVEPKEAEIVRLVFELYVTGDGASGPMGLTQIAGALNAREFRSREGGPFYIQGLQKMLRNTAYVGTHFFNKTCSKTRTLRPESEWVPLETPKIVEDQLFYAVQDKLDHQHPLKTAPRIVNSGILLTGLAFCAACGGPLRIQTGKGGRYRYYKCGVRSDKGETVCKGCSAPMEALDGQVLDALIDEALEPERVGELLSRLLARLKDSRAGLAARRADLHGRKRKAEEGLKRLLAFVEDGGAERDATVGARIKALQDDIKEAVHLLAALELKSEAPLSRLSGADGARFAKAIAARLKDKDDPHFARAYLRLFISRIDVAKDKITITGPDDAIAASAAAFATSGAMVPSFAPEWRTRRDSNS